MVLFYGVNHHPMRLESGSKSHPRKQNQIQVAKHTWLNLLLCLFDAYRGISQNGGTPTTIGFPSKHDHFVVFGGYHHLRKHPYMFPQNGVFFAILCDKSNGRTNKNKKSKLTTMTLTQP